MFNPFYIFIGQRYTLIKGKNHFISFISLTSMLGIALGVMVLITVMSVMNGFGKEIRAQMLSGTPHITLSAAKGRIAKWEELTQKLSHYPDIVGTSPYILGQAMVSTPDSVQGVLVKGIEPQVNDQVTKLQDHLIEGELNNLNAGEYGIVLGKDLALKLGLKLNDKVSLIIPEILSSPVGVSPRIKRFKVVGIFKINYFYDNSHAFVHLKDAEKLYRMGNEVSGIQIKIKDELEAPQIVKKLRKGFSHTLDFYDWTHENESFFQAIKMEKTVMMFILLLIIAVAAFNLVSSLVMMVTDKRSDIAILRTIGATPHEIMGVFMVQGSSIGLMGTALGVITGLLLAYNVTAVTNFLQNLFQVQFISADVYFINYLPSDVHLQDVLQITGLTLLLSFLATLYPAWKASNIHPAEALRYE